MNNLLVLIFIWSVCWLPCYASAASIQKAQMFQENGLKKEAKKELIDILFSESKSDSKAHALYLLGNMVFEEGNTELAEKYWNRLEKEFSDSSYSKLVKKQIEPSGTKKKEALPTVSKESSPQMDETTALQKASEIAEHYSISNKLHISIIKNRLIYNLPIDKNSLQKIGILPDPSNPDKENQFNHWRVKQSKSLIDDSSNVTLTLSSNEQISGHFGTAKRPILIVRCKENKTSVYIDTKAVMSESEATIRLDSEPAFIEPMLKSTDSKALFFSSPISTLKKFWNHNQLLFRYTPYNSGEHIISFDMRGLKQVIKPLRKACHW